MGASWELPNFFVQLLKAALTQVMGHIGMCRYRKANSVSDARSSAAHALCRIATGARTASRRMPTGLRGSRKRAVQDYKDKVGDDPTKHFTDEELKERDRLSAISPRADKSRLLWPEWCCRLLKDGEEAQWCLFDPILGSPFHESQLRCKRPIPGSSRALWALEDGQRLLRPHVPEDKGDGNKSREPLKNQNKSVM